jgi:hypothetical protein
MSLALTREVPSKDSSSSSTLYDSLQVYFLYFHIGRIPLILHYLYDFLLSENLQCNKH